MAQKIWTGSINFGLVSIPVGLYAATEDHSIPFHQYERGTTDRVRYRRVNERTGNEVSYGDIVKGREVGDTLVTVDPSELEEIAPRRSRTIDITSFVDLDEIDPVYFQKTYWLAPSSKDNSRPYSLLLRAMREANRVGVATFVMRGKEYLTAIRADRDALALDTLYFADEIRDANAVVGDLDTLDGKTKNADRELSMATDIIDSMTEDWKPEQYEDTYTARVEQLLQDKAQGKEPTVEEAAERDEGVIDLTEALRRSVDAAKQRRTSSGSHANTGAQPSDRDVGEMTKSELDGLAREHEIKGRSKMSRGQLEDAVAEALGTPRRTRKAS